MKKLAGTVPPIENASVRVVRPWGMTSPSKAFCPQAAKPLTPSLLGAVPYDVPNRGDLAAYWLFDLRPAFAKHIQMPIHAHRSENIRRETGDCDSLSLAYSRDTSPLGGSQPAIRRTSRLLHIVTRAWGISAQREDIHAFVLTGP